MVCILTTVHKWIQSKVDPETPGNVAMLIITLHSNGRKHYSWKKKIGLCEFFPKHQ